MIIKSFGKVKENLFIFHYNSDIMYVTSHGGASGHGFGNGNGDGVGHGHGNGDGTGRAGGINFIFK